MRPDALTDTSDTTIEHGNARLGAERPRATGGLKLGIVRLGRAAGKVSPFLHPYFIFSSAKQGLADKS